MRKEHSDGMTVFNPTIGEFQGLAHRACCGGWGKRFQKELSTKYVETLQAMGVDVDKEMLEEEQEEVEQLLKGDFEGPSNT